MAGLGENGFVIKSQEEIIEDLRTAARDAFADLVPAGDEVRTDSSSVIGRLIGVQTPLVVDIWESIQEVYDAFNLEAASDIALDNIVAIGGVKRNQASPTVADMRLTGDYLTFIPSGTQFSSKQTGKAFETQLSNTLNATAINGVKVGVQTVQNSTLYRLTFSRNPDATGAGSQFIDYTSDASATETEILNGLKTAINTSFSSVFTATVVDNTLVIDAVDLSLNYNFGFTNNLLFTQVSKEVETLCTENGPNAQAPNTITTIVTPVLGLTAVTNSFAAATGTNRETDEELRVRYRTSKSSGALSTLEALYSDVSKVEGVQDLFIFPNEQETTFNGYTVPVPPHSIYVVVQGGPTQEIGDAIFNNKAAGIGTAGSEAVIVQDDNGFNHTINFQRPNNITIYIDLEIDPEPTFEANGVDKIKTAIVQYFFDNIGLGDDVLYSRLYEPINSVKGHFVNSLTVGTAPNPTGTSNIVVADDEIATTIIANINITVV